MTDRIDQINDHLLHNLAEVLSQEIEVPQDMFITVTNFKTAANLKNAKVALSVLPFTKAQDGLNWIIAHRKEIQYQLGLRTKRLHNTPVMHFVLDSSEESASKINEIIDDLDIDSQNA